METRGEEDENIIRARKRRRRVERRMFLGFMSETTTVVAHATNSETTLI